MRVQGWEIESPAQALTLPGPGITDGIFPDPLFSYISPDAPSFL
jgi:hypothetical protein